MQPGSETVDLSRIATDHCTLPGEMIDCLLRLARRSISPIVVSGEQGHSLQQHGHSRSKKRSRPGGNSHKPFLHA
jgi:hypothetical protein